MHHNGAFWTMRKWRKKIGIEISDKWLIPLDHVTFMFPCSPIECCICSRIYTGITVTYYCYNLSVKKEWCDSMVWFCVTYLLLKRPVCRWLSCHKNRCCWQTWFGLSWQRDLQELKSCGFTMLRKISIKFEKQKSCTWTCK